ncbi:MAG: hypothetical protein JHC93_01045 [Parachlamydiales bacterium]|nr:hypothetical protein [Parachlamydiales bacterium]
MINLPKDIINSILPFLDTKDLHSLQQVSKLTSSYLKTYREDLIQTLVNQVCRGSTVTCRNTSAQTRVEWDSCIRLAELKNFRIKDKVFSKVIDTLNKKGINLKYFSEFGPQTTLAAIKVMRD